MKNSAKHSPLPFYRNSSCNGTMIYYTRSKEAQLSAPSFTENFIALCLDEEDAEFIISACNSHDKLVEALKELVNIVEDYQEKEWYLPCVDNGDNDVEVPYLISRVKQLEKAHGRISQL